MSTHKFSGVEPTDKTKEGTDKVIHVIGNKDFNDIKDAKLAALGVADGKKVRKAIAQVDRDLVFESMDYTGKLTAQTGKTSILKLGTGDGSMTAKTTASRKNPNPKAKDNSNEPATLTGYGIFSIEKKVALPNDAEFNARRAEVREAVEAKLTKKK